jgi:hypothetical protein
MLAKDLLRLSQMDVQAVSSAPPSTGSQSASSSEWDFSFRNLLDIINPLEHLPVISLVYRAITGAHPGTPEKIAGDALYGGVWGLVSGVADAAFEAVTGEDLGDTVLALFRPSANKELAQVTVTPAATLPSDPATSPQETPGTTALRAALSQRGVDSDLAQRAIAAYRKSIALPSPVFQAAS